MIDLVIFIGIIVAIAGLSYWMAKKNWHSRDWPGY